MSETFYKHTSYFQELKLFLLSFAKCRGQKQNDGTGKVRIDDI